MSSLASYFRTRVGKPVTWSFETKSNRHGDAYRRDYLITSRGVDRDILAATVTSHDFDMTGNRTTKVPVNWGPVQTSMAGLANPADVLEEIARTADPAYFAKHPRVSQKEESVDSLDARIAAIVPAAGEIPPTPVSSARLRKFWVENPGLVLPTLFSAKDGAIRARWNEGKERTAWVNFPEKGPLGLSVSMPRNGGYGLRKVNARCIDDQDVIAIIELLGVRCTRPS